MRKIFTISGWITDFPAKTDHKPLVPIMMTKDIDRTPLRCQRMLMRMMRFNAKVVHIQGKELLIADTLSRFPVGGDETSQIKKIVSLYIYHFEDVSVTPGRLSKIKAATGHDTDIQEVMSYVLHGWPSKVSEHIMKYKREGHFSVKNGLLIMDSRIVIPETQRNCTKATKA